jgi:hypothetical protein
MSRSAPDPSRHRARGPSLAAQGAVDRPAMQPVSSRPNSGGYGAERVMATNTESLTHDAAPRGRVWMRSVRPSSGATEQIDRKARARRGRER